MKRQFSREEVQRHNTKNSAWVIVDGEVFDVTSWVPKHPGGSRLILEFSGTDCSDEFAAFHAPRSRGVLERYKIGVVSDPGTASREVKAYRRLRSKLWAEGSFKVHPSYVITSLAKLASLAILAFVCVGIKNNTMVTLVGGIFLGLFEQQSLLMAHDLLHRSIFKKRNVSFWSGWFTGTVCGGVGAAWWRRDHFVHHALTNVLEVDPSAGADPFVFIDSQQFLRKKRSSVEHFLLKIQPYLYFPLCLIFARFNLHFVSVLASPSKGVDLCGVVLHFGWKWLLLSRLTTVRLACYVWCTAYLVCSILHLQLNVGHFTSHMCTKNSALRRGFFRHQIATTVNITCSPLEHWFHGGLEYQIEHHLFPMLPRFRLSEIAPLVQKISRNAVLTYREETFLRANGSCWRSIKACSDVVRSSKN